MEKERNRRGEVMHRKVQWRVPVNGLCVQRSALIQQSVDQNEVSCLQGEMQQRQTPFVGGLKETCIGVYGREHFGVGRLFLAPSGFVCLDKFT